MPSSTTRPHSVPFSQGTSLHRQLFLVLRDQILRGVFKPGETLPKEDLLCERFAVSKITVRRALADLAAQSLIERRQGTAARVSPHASIERGRPMLGLIETLQRTAVETDVQVLEVNHVVPNREVSALLRLVDGTKAVHSLRLRSPKGGPPSQLIEAWVPLPIGRKITAASLKKKPLYEILTAEGIQFGRVIQEISGVIADPVRAHLLQMDVGLPLIRLFRLVHDVDDQPVQLFETYLAADRARLLMEIPGSAINTFGAGQVVHDAPMKSH